jgi:hypothetical protein
MSFQGAVGRRWSDAGNVAVGHSGWIHLNLSRTRTAPVSRKGTNIINERSCVHLSG